MGVGWKAPNTKTSNWGPLAHFFVFSGAGGGAWKLKGMDYYQNEWIKYTPFT
jgi:hypothetical protein